MRNGDRVVAAAVTSDPSCGVPKGATAHTPLESLSSNQSVFQLEQKIEHCEFEQVADPLRRPTQESRQPTFLRALLHEHEDAEPARIELHRLLKRHSGGAA